jgi:cell division protein FtsB
VKRDALIRIVKIAAIIAAIAFAVEAGEFGTSDLIRQRGTKQRLIAENDSMKRLTDSLAAYRNRLETDPALQERIAREEFGMVKAKELQYRFVDTTRPNRP